MTKDEAQHSRWTFYEAVKGYNKHLGDARKGGPPTSREKGGKSYRTGALLLLRHDRGSSSDIASRPGVTATTDMTVLPGVLGCSFDRLPLRRTVQVRLGSNHLRLPGGTAISTASRHQFMKYPG